MMMPLSGAWAFSSKLLQILKKVNLIVDQEQIGMLIGETKHGPTTLNDPLCSFSENICPLENDDMLSCEGKVTQGE